jgi:hypothetical protein
VKALAILSLLEVEASTLLTAIAVDEKGTYSPDPTEPTSGVTTWRFYLDDIGAEVGEDHCGPWTGHIRGQVDDTYVAQWSAVGFLHNSVPVFPECDGSAISCRPG